MKRLVLSIAGYSASGKTTVAGLLREHATVLSVGEVVRKRLARTAGSEWRRVGYTDIEQAMAKDGAFVALCLLDAVSAMDGIVIIEGAKNRSDLALIHEMSVVRYLSVFASRETRFRRLVQRARRDRPPTIGELRRRDLRETEYGLRELVLTGDVFVEAEWSDLLVQMARLTALLEDDDDSMAQSLGKALERKHGDESMSERRKEAKRNDERAMREEYWIEEVSATEARYEQGRTPWDIGRPDANLRERVGALAARGQKVLEVGCGTGTDAVWLAEQGYDVVAIEVACVALGIARERARRANVSVRLESTDFLGDAVHGSPFSLVYERGCFHAITNGDERRRFVAAVAKNLDVGGHWLTLSGNADDTNWQGPGPTCITATELVSAVEPSFEVLSLRAGRFDDSESEPAAWIGLFRRRSSAP